MVGISSLLEFSDELECAFDVAGGVD